LDQVNSLVENMKKATPIFVISFLILSVGLFSGCEKKEVVEPVEQEGEQQEKEGRDEVSKKEEPFQLPDMNQDNWKTYTDDAWGFSIKFPKEFHYKVHTQGESYPGEECVMCGNGGQLLIISDQEDMGIQDVELDERIHIVVSTSKENTPLDKIEGYAYSKVEIGKETGILINPKNIELNEYCSVNLNIERNGWLYNVYGETHEVESRKDIHHLINQIMSTFQFTN
jgi:hypothetical protein